MKFGSVLIAGCGGTGTEVLKLLLQNEFKSLTVVDYDKVDLSNLNRQFFYSISDIGKYKAKVLHDKITKNMTLNKESKIIYYTCKVEEMILADFDIIFCCLDSVSSRMVLNMFNYGTLIDCGVEGSKCHVKIVKRNRNKVADDKQEKNNLFENHNPQNYLTSCLYCIKNLYSINNTFNICTQRDIENLSDRNEILKNLCAKYENINEVIKNFNQIAFVKNYIKTNIFEVTGIKLNIIPSVSYTNSICASLAFWIVEEDMNDFVFYNGSEFTKLSLKKDSNCIVCI
ncbi:hypothetical protein COBT_000374 [Conglomerata obtusa]